MKHRFGYLSLLLVTLFSLGAQATTNSDKVVSFSAWKQQQVTEASQQLGAYNKLHKRNKVANPSEIMQRNLGKELQWRLEVTRNLTIQDYFISYLAPRLTQGKDLPLSAIEALSTEELKILLENYALHLKPLETKDSLKMRSASQLINEL